MKSEAVSSKRMKKSKKMRSEASTSSSNNSNRRGTSVVADRGTRRSACGYCISSGRTSITHGLLAYSLLVDDYQDLLDRGWRRFGTLLCKTDMERTCCPSYTIRLRASDFVPSKEQRRVVRRMQRFLDGTLDVEKKLVDFVEDPGTSNRHKVSSSVENNSLSHNNKEKSKEEDILHYLSGNTDNAVQLCITSGEFPSDIQLPKASVKRVSQAKSKLLVEGTEKLLYSSNIAFQIVATLKRARLAEKDVQQIRILGQSAEDKSTSPKIIAEKLASSLIQLSETSALSVRACNGHLNFYSAVKLASSDEDTQIATISEESTKGCDSKSSLLKNSSEKPRWKKHKLQIRLKRSSFDPQEFQLYRKYQINVHNENPDLVTETSYRKFLVASPLVFVASSGDRAVPSCGFGSFHQQYLIDDQLVAVGVIDILPSCLSSIYFFWDPDYAFLSLGKYSALREIEWLKENQAHCATIQYYYLGYYIHSCQKMRYKAAYCPSELLCPLRYIWVPYDITKPLLDRKPYVVLSDFASLQTESSPPCVSESQHDDICPEDSNGVLMDYDNEMLVHESESDDDSPDTGTRAQTVAVEDGDISNIIIGCKGTRARYKDIPKSFDPIQRTSLESQLLKYRTSLKSQLLKYMRVVGAELSEKMVYALG